MNGNGNLPIDTVICGDVVETLKTLPDESVNCIVTSPPYWGLRSYGEETKRVWGGDPKCGHDWTEEAKKRVRPKQDHDGSGGFGPTRNQEDTREATGGGMSQGSCCTLCGAWHGQLGLEPRLEMFLEHMLEVTAELKRVLRKDGTLWWNHGDCYGTHTDKRSGQFGKDIKEGFDDVFQRKRLQGGPIREKCLALQNYRLVLRMLDDQGWILRNTVIWHKPNGMPSSVRDRFSNRYEPVFVFSKSERYWFDLDAVRVPHSEPLHAPGNKNQVPLTHHFDEPDRTWGSSVGKNPGDVVTIPTQPFSDAHFAVFPEKLISPFILAGCPGWVCTKCGKPRMRVMEQGERVPCGHGSSRKAAEVIRKYRGESGLKTSTLATGEKYEYSTKGWTRCSCGAPFTGGIVLDPFGGSGTTGLVAKKLNRRYILIDLNPEYCEMARKRIGQVSECLPFEAPDVDEATATKSEQAEISL